MLKDLSETWSRERYAVIQKTYSDQMPLFHLQGHRNPLRVHEILEATNVNEPPRKVVAQAASSSKITKYEPKKNY